MESERDVPLLAIRGLRAAYGKIEALKGRRSRDQRRRNRRADRRQRAGKSTLMMTIFGKPRARAGQIQFDGPILPTCRPIRSRDCGLRNRRRPTDFPAHERRGKPADGRGRHRMQRGERSAVLERVFMLFPRLKERMTQRGGTLSAANNRCWRSARVDEPPRLLMLDEPSLGLAPLIARQISTPSES